MAKLVVFTVALTAGERALRLIAATLRILASGGTGPSSVPALKIANRIERTITR